MSCSGSSPSRAAPARRRPRRSRPPRSAPPGSRASRMTLLDRSRGPRSAGSPTSASRRRATMAVEVEPLDRSSPHLPLDGHGADHSASRPHRRAPPDRTASLPRAGNRERRESADHAHRSWPVGDRADDDGIRPAPDRRRASRRAPSSIAPARLAGVSAAGDRRDDVDRRVRPDRASRGRPARRRRTR